MLGVGITVFSIWGTPNRTKPSSKSQDTVLFVKLLPAMLTLLAPPENKMAPPPPTGWLGAAAPALCAAIAARCPRVGDAAADGRGRAHAGDAAAGVAHHRLVHPLQRLVGRAHRGLRREEAAHGRVGEGNGIAILSCLYWLRGCLASIG